MQSEFGLKPIPLAGGSRWLAAAGVFLMLFSGCGFGSNNNSTMPPAEGEAQSTQTAPSEPRPTPTKPYRWWPGVFNEQPPPATPTPVPEEALGPDGLFKEIQVSQQGDRHLVPLHQILSGGVAKDGIPAIDEPQFADRAGWDELDYDPDKLVIGVEVDGLRRAYPFQVLVWHELVNDTINGKPILISYCPLCGSAIAFEPELDVGGALGAVEFGVSGLLYNSDLLMYDRETDSLWSQILGIAVFGELTGARLDFYPSEIMTWADWQAAYPDSQVLTRDTGPHKRNYDRDPYGEYYLTPEIMFSTNQSSENFDALYPKKEVTGVEVRGAGYHMGVAGLDGPVYGAYVNHDVIAHGPVNDTLGDTPLLVVADPTAGDNVVVFHRSVDGRELTFVADGDTLIDEQTRSRWTYDGLAIKGEMEGMQLTEIVAVKSFWFAWVAFHPETEIWQAE
ncbi:DUF3179 domain-containing protein [soil metagenome]